MKWTFIFFLFLIISSCEDRSTPTIHPSKIGVDSAYIDLVNKDRKIQKNISINDTLPIDDTLKNNHLTSKEIIQKNTEEKASPIDKIIPPSSNNTTENLEVSYAKAKAEPSKIAGQTNTFTFDADTAKKVRIKISAKDTAANIRINYISGPIDSIKGGPFGKETIFKLPVRGIYQFSISENPTNPIPYNGKYKIELKLLWK